MRTKARSSIRSLSACPSSQGASRVAHSLVTAPLVILAASVAILAPAGAPAQAHVFHNYESSIAAVPAEGPGATSVEVPGPLRRPEAMTVFSGDLYVAENLNGKFGPSTNFRADQFAPTGSTPDTYDFVSQLPQLPALTTSEKGIALGTASGETELYLGEQSGDIAAVGVGSCGALECALLQQTWSGSDTPSHAFAQILGVAVDDSASAEDWARGDVFVLQETVPDAIAIFKPEADGKEKYEAEITGPSPSEPFTEVPSSIAVSGFNGDVVVDDGHSVDVFKPEEESGTHKYVLVQALTPPGNGLGQSHGDSVAVDGGNGEIYVETETTIYEYGPEGALRGTITGEGTPELEWSNSTEASHALRSIAVDSSSHRVFVGVWDGEEQQGVVDVFGPDVVVPDVATEPVSNVVVQPATHSWDAQLNGTVNPDDAGPVTCMFAWGDSKSLGSSEPCASAVGNGDATRPVQATLTGLAPGTTYYYRLQASNASGRNPGEEAQDQEFTTPGPHLQGESVSDVSSSSARLEATVNPRNVATAYRFEYDTRAYAPNEARHGTSAPLADSSIGSGSGNVEVEQNVQGLQADATYHYRVVAVSEVEVAPGRFESEEFDGPDQTFTTQALGGPLTLPDNRAWELVSPVDKRGAVIEPLNEAGIVQAAAAGGAITYLATSPTESEPQGFAHGLELGVQVLSTRTADGWSSQDLSLSHRAEVGVVEGLSEEYRFFSDDLGLGVAESFGPFSPPAHENISETSPEATEATPYLRHDTTCLSTPSSCYEPLVTSAPEGGDEPEGAAFGGQVRFVGATPDANHVVLNSDVKLTSSSAPDGGLYEWSAEAPAPERLELVSVLPEGEGGVAAASPQLGQGDVERYAISDDGERIFFSEGDSLYVRDTVTSETVRLDLAEEASGKATLPALYQTASANGSTVFFTDAAPLTKSSGRQGQDLYECTLVDVEEAGEKKLKCALTDLTPAAASAQSSPGESAEVQADALGASEDGSYVYFVANGQQAAGASPGDCRESGSVVSGSCNLYVAHESDGMWTTKFIAMLSGDDASDWGAGAFGGLRSMTSRVSPDGAWLAFMSDRSLTGYDNRDAVSGMPDEEVYLYNAVSERLVCASCDPTGARPDGVEYGKLNGGLAGGSRVWSEHQWLAANTPSWTSYTPDNSLYQSRYLSDSGRLFFDSSDALAPQDINGNEDVYEYEPSSVGSCVSSAVTYSDSSGGCVGLISSGVAHGESAFLDASESGGDVFFLTTEKLVPQDVDTALDVYDAHECTLALPCPAAPPTQPPECRSAASCRAAPSSQPSIFGPPASATFSGAGNVAPLASAPKQPKTSAQVRAEDLAKALKACGKKKIKHKRRTCDALARKRYGIPTKATKSGKAKQAGNKRRGK
jgi:WD40-like Beta Propeller Repeat